MRVLSKKKKFNKVLVFSLSVLGVLMIGIFITLGQLNTSKDFRTRAQVALSIIGDSQSRLYLSPQTLTAAPGVTFQAAIRVDSGPNLVNAVQTNISYPSNLLAIDAIDYTNSAFSIQAQELKGIGTLKIARGTTTPVSGDQLIATLTFRTLATGTALVAFDAGSAVVTSTANQNILTETLSGSYLIALPTATPTAFLDTIVPTVSFTNPLNGSKVARKATIPLSASATDNVGVTQVQFYVNKTLLCSDTLTPYQCNWRVPAGKRSSYTLKAQASDAAGNTGSQTITVTAQ